MPPLDALGPAHHRWPDDDGPWEIEVKADWINGQGHVVDARIRAVPGTLPFEQLTAELISSVPWDDFAEQARRRRAQIASLLEDAGESRSKGGRGRPPLEVDLLLETLDIAERARSEGTNQIETLMSALGLSRSGAKKRLKTAREALSDALEQESQ
jgi:hypothetical protein